MSRLPIRIRLTLAFAAAMAAVIGGGGYLLFQHFAVSLDRTVDQALRTRAADAATLVQQVHGPDGPRQETGGGLGEPPPIADSGDSFVQALDARGRIFDQTRGLGSKPLLDTRQLAQARLRTLLIRRTQRLGADVRLLAVPVTAQDRHLVIVVGIPLRARDETLASLRSDLLVGGPLALLVISLIGYLLAAAALRPVERMRTRAGSISERQLSERLPVSRAHDELRRLGETLNAMLARIESGVTRERRFVADASHELRTPLALVRAEVELALEGHRDNEELRAALASVGEEADRLSQLAEDLLLLARLDEGGLELRPEPLDVGTLLADVAARFARRAAEAGRPIEVDEAQLRMRGDRLRLEQALANLVENALRYGEGTIHLRAEGTGDGVAIHVADEGSGFAAEFLPVAFERFTRADPTRVGGGAGLGLAIVRAIAEAHGGSVAVEPTEDAGGADLCVLLPQDGSLPGDAPDAAAGPLSSSRRDPRADGSPSV